MTPREPDRFEAKAREVFRSVVMDEARAVPMIAAALRAAESSALERAARIARRYSHHAEREIRALIPPAAAPAEDSALESMCDCGRHVEGEKYALPAGGHVRAAHVDAPAAETGKAQGAEARIAELETAIRWALGEEGEFRAREPGEGAFWWRIELRKRAGGWK